jgi:uncharacterized protein involved in exopolysaccharide biosynthesis
VEIIDTGTALQRFLEEQAVRYREVLSLSQEQLRLVEQNQAPELMEVLSRKQAIIQVLDDASEQAAPLLARWEEGRNQASETLRSGVREAHEQLTSVMAEVIALEDQAKSIISQGRGTTGKQMLNLQKGKQMLRAYGATPPPGDARFTDKRK